MAAKIANTYFEEVERLLKAAKGDEELFRAIVNVPFHDPLQTTSLDLGIIVLLQVNKKQGTIDRVALSQTEQAEGTLKMTLKPFTSIKIPLDHYNNIIAEAIRINRPQQTGDWQYLFTPALPAQAARLNQSGGGIECSCVYPLTARDGGALIFSFYQPPHSISDQHRNFMAKYCKLVNSVLHQKSNSS